MQVATGIHWLRMPLPFKPDHINLWLLQDDDEDGPGWTIVDTGYAVDQTRTLWEQLLAGPMANGRVKRIIVTHFHPDHVGCARWLSEKTGAMVWMTTGEYLSAHAAHADVGGFDRANTGRLFMRHGLGKVLSAPPAPTSDPRAAAPTGERRDPPVPACYRRLMDGEQLSIGAHRWRVITAFGHAPEHATLACEDAAVLIAGDQILPTITPNISVWGNQPESNPLGQYLGSLSRFEPLAENTLVLPSHGRVFLGLHERLAALRTHHEDKLEALLAELGEPRCAADILPVLFKRPLGEFERILAMGEAIAHLHWLMYAGSASRQTGEDGLITFQALRPR
ncbi:MAG: MBL fold metallo-hydrolase [Betaproteobacteria bacterium]|nr:MBL fold metallo-hydrolase [Betaproteobacteria bacterium]